MIDKNEPSSLYVFFTIVVIALSLVAGGLSWFYLGTSPLLSYLIGVNIGSFIAMGFDKAYARANALRIPEKVLFGIALVGGSAGTLIACHVIRHKTRKATFQFFLILILAVHVVLLRWAGIRFR